MAPPDIRWEDLHKPTYYVAGATVFTFANLLSQPFTLIKRRQQMGVLSRSSSTLASLGTIARAEGISGLFRSGFLSWIPGCSRTVYFTAYEHIDKYVMRFVDEQLLLPIQSTISDQELQHRRSRYKALSLGIAGGLSVFFHQFVMVPYAVVTTPMQLHSAGTTRLPASQVLRDILSRNQVSFQNPARASILWTGYWSTVAQLVPQQAATWTMYSFCKTLLLEWTYKDDDNTQKDLGLWGRVLCSLCSSGIAIVATSPIDVVRTNRQALVSSVTPTTTAGSSSAAALSSFPSRQHAVASSSTVVREIYREQGARGFFRGMSARALASCPPLMTMMVGYEYVKVFAAAASPTRS